LTIECWQVRLFKHGSDLLLTTERLLPTPDLKQAIEQKKKERRATKWQRDPSKIQLIKYFREKAADKKWQTRSIQGASYYVFVTLPGLADITFGADGSSPYISVPAGDGFDTETLTSEAWQEEGKAKVYRFLEANLNQESDRTRIVEDAVKIIQELPRLDNSSNVDQISTQGELSPDTQLKRIDDPEHPA